MLAILLPNCQLLVSNHQIPIHNNIPYYLYKIKHTLKAGPSAQSLITSPENLLDLQKAFSYRTNIFIIDPMKFL